MSKFSAVFDIGVDILSSAIDKVTKTILVQTGSVTESIPRSDNAELWQQCGFASLPANPIGGTSAAQGIAIRCSDRDRVIATRDTRGQAIYGSLSPGETCVYAGGPDGKAQGRALFKANGSVTLYTAQGNVAGGPSVTVQLNATDGSIAAANQYGALSLGPNGFQIAMKGGAGFMMDLAGNVSLVGGLGGSAVVNASAVSIGANATLPACVGPAGISAIGSTSVKIAL